MTTFTDLGLAPAILKALDAEGYSSPTPIQAQAIPHVLAGRDLQGIAQTGTGKTAAFALPILHRLISNPKPAPRRGARAVILSPTRELASQIADSFKAYGRHLGLTITTVFGGVSARPQAHALVKGVDILVATPGRLMDHMGMGNLRLDQTEIFVLDEADQMLDLGFIHAIRALVKELPKVRQSLFFSATMPPAIGNLAAELLSDPVRVSVTPVATTAERVEQRVIFLPAGEKRDHLAKLFADSSMERVLVFTRTKHGADRVTQHLEKAGIGAAAIHGNKSQSQRERALTAFKAGKARALVATDIAARGIDVDGVTHVVNFELPNVPESYVHRIGRTARAGAAGIAISFCDGEEKAYLRDIEKLIRQKVPAFDRDGQPMASPALDAGPRPSSPKPRQGAKPHRGKRPAFGGGRSGSTPPSSGQQAPGRRGASPDGTRTERPQREDGAPAFLKRKGDGRRRFGGQGRQRQEGGQA
ncbi:DEAD/DEAH box helicase [Agaricicola taiwanensis]|uniref:DEAD/DEAH box helicase n=1 Tax=Agaricicola taiwanensis TaxID=591372 RepID=UPI00166D6339|nr:DEAD/DEAH box helicase [Agaricicola taiwanensis]